MICPKCGKTVDRAAKFCPGCGARLIPEAEKQRYCPSCGAKVVGKFCGACGKPIEQSAAPKPVSRPAPDRPRPISPAEVTAAKPKKTGKLVAVILSVIVAIAIIAVIIGVVVGASNKNVFDRATVDRVELGMTADEVSSILGTPDKTVDNFEIRYGKNAADIKSGRWFEAVIVNYSDGKVEYVLHALNLRYDANYRKYSMSDETVKTETLDLDEFEAIEVDGVKHVSSLLRGASYRAEFTDGSFLKSYVGNAYTFRIDGDSATATWNDEITSYSVTRELVTAATVTDGILDSYRGESRACIIPNGVTAIGDGAFSNCIKLERIKLPDRVVRIGANAFSGCTALQEINFPVALETVEPTAFGGCASLKTVMYDSDNFELDIALRNLSGLDIIFGGGHADIPQSAFNGCKSLASVTFGRDVKSVGSSAFFGCTALETVNFLGEVETIGDYAFRNTAWYNAHTGLVTVGSQLIGCNGSLAEISVPDGVKYIPHGCFAGQPATSITLPSSLVRIGAHAFESCKELEYIEIPGKVAEVGEYAFASCSSLEKLLIPSSIEHIGANAFFGCYELSEFFVAADSLPNATIDVLINTGGGKTAIVYAPDWEFDEDGVPIRPWTLDGTTVVKYRGAKAEPMLPNGVTAIGAEAFAGNIFIERVTLPDSVTEIGSRAFAGCACLEKVNIPRSLTTIASGAFDGCTSLNSLVWAANKWDMEGAFSELKKLAALDIEFVGSYTEIPDYAFRELTNIKSVSFPASVTKLGVGVFAGCYSLENVEFAGYITEARNYAFGWTKWLSGRPYGEVYLGDALIAYNTRNNNAPSDTVYVKNGVKYIPGYCFSGVRGLKTIILPDSVIEIGSYAFKDCAELEYIRLSPALETIPYYAFSGCVSLEKIIGMGGVVKLCDYAFSGCASLTDFKIGAVTVGQGCFTACTSLASVEIGAAVITMGANVFTGCTALETIALDAKALRDNWDEEWLGDCTAEIIIKN